MLARYGVENQEGKIDVIENPVWDDLKPLLLNGARRDPNEHKIYIMPEIEMDKENRDLIKTVQLGFPSLRKHFVYTLPYMGFNGAAALAQRILDASVNIH